jgi:hypothetical protein
MYRGVYLQPETVDAKKNSWRFAVDMMFSVHVRRPIGLPTVEPVWQVVQDRLHAAVRGDAASYKSLPELVSESPKAFEARFPVQVSTEAPS